jgi:crotonobetainyl-CoA:carnitine CoA-transferase CaiB-like acyl-CoA transferase
MDLSAVRVLDFTHLLPGPYATQLLRDMGAEVWKVERPGEGDPARAFGSGRSPDGHAALFDVLNRGKRSVTLDLKTDAGRRAFLDLAAEADAVIEQFRPGVVDRLGVGYEEVRAVNEAVVYCSVAGYGQDGPYADRPGHDLNYAGLAGLLEMTRPDAEAAPVIPGFPVADMAGGLFAALSVVSALLSRELGAGGGEHLDVSLSDAALSLSQLVAGPAVAGVDQRPGETVVTGKYPCYGVYECADGRYLTLGALEGKFWDALCGAIDRPDLRGAHMAEDPDTRERVRDELESVFDQRPRERWVERLAEADVPAGPVLTVEEAFDDDHLRVRDVVGDVDGRLRRAAFPVESTDEPARTDAPAPALGEHTDEILRAVGYSDGRIERLRADGVL